MWLTARFRFVLRMVVDVLRFPDVSWWLVGPRMNCSPTVLVQNAHHWNQLHTTTSGQQMLGKANIAENELLGIHSNLLHASGANHNENANSHSNCGKAHYH